LSSNGIGNEGTANILNGILMSPETPDFNNTLVSLNLSHNELTLPAIEKIQEVLPKTKLRELILSLNNIGNQGAELLSKVIGEENKDLVKLNLQNCKISGQGAVHIFEALKENTSIQ
jgi:Ran GTPase-activating protein (RanGAP) involved in mRNA processing and transport